MTDSTTTSSTLLPGTILGDEYQVLKPLGSGAMGSVLLATDLTLDRFVAIKVLHDVVGERFESDDHFLREARMLSRISHPNIVTVHAFARTPRSQGGRHFIVMEYVAGETLEDHLARQGALAPRTCCHVMAQICSAVGEAHRRGIVHRDLKPGNTLVTTVGGDPYFMKVVDFGLAQRSRRDADLPPLEGGEAGQGFIAGTPAYMAPEQAQGQDIDGRADIYSLGVMATELLTGMPPFHGREALALLIAHVAEPPRLPSTLRPDMGFEPGGPVDQVMARALAKDPADRQPDAQTLARELLRAVRAWRPAGTGLFDVGLTGAVGGEEDTWEDAPRVGDPAGARTTTSRPTLVDLGIRLTDETAPARRHVAILYLEFEGAAVAAADAIEDHIECLAVVAAKVRQAVLEQGGQLVGALAERQIAFFGLGAEDELGIEQAVAAGLTVRRALSGLVDDPTIPATFELSFRIGVDAGPMVVGDVRETGLLLHGEPLFRARDVARRADPGEVRIARGAFRVIRGLFECRPVRVRGSGTHWIVSGRKAVARHTADVDVYGVPIAMVGRQQELAAALDAVDAASRRRQLIPLLVHGPPGVGKTRLARELAASLDERPAPYFFEAGRCTPGGHSAPYEPFVQALRGRARLEETDDDAAVRDRINQYLRRWVARDATALDPAETRMRQGLEELLLVGSASQSLAHAHTVEVHGEEAQRAALFERIAALYRRIAERDPLVFVIDDFQWASAPTRQLLAYLTTHLADVPATVIVLQRDDGDDPAPEDVFPDHPSARRVALQPLDERQTGRLIRHALRSLVEVPRPLVRAIRGLAQGIPLIVEETIHDLIDEGAIEVDEGRWRLVAPTIGQLRLPGTVAQLLAGRVERLPPALRGALEVCAVAGRRVWPELLADLTDDAAGRDTLAEMERRGFMAPLREVVVAGSHDWGFLQVAMQETVYGLVPRSRKRGLHARVAAWLEEHAQGSGGQIDDEIGHHYQAAGDAAQALRHRRAAAGRAKRVYALEEATRHLTACRELLELIPVRELPTPERRAVTVDVLEDLMNLRALSGDLQGAAKAADEALALLPSGADPRRVRVAVRKGWVLMFLGRYKEAAQATRAVRGEGLAATDPVLALRVATLDAAVAAKMGDASGAAAAMRAAIQVHGSERRDAAALAHLSEAYRTLGNCEVWQGQARHAQARDAYETAHSLAERANAPEMRVDALNGLAALRYYQGDPAGAVARWREALDTAERWDLQQHRLILLNNLAEVTGSQGDHAGAVELASRAEALGRFLGTDEAQADAHRIHAEALLALGDPQGAVEHGRRALHHAELVGSPHFIGPAHRIVAEALHALLRRRAGGDATPKAVAGHLDAAIAAFSGAAMQSEVDATRALRRRFLGG